MRPASLLFASAAGTVAEAMAGLKAGGTRPK